MALEGQVRYTTHPNDHALTILYATDENWSKNMRKRSVEVNGQTVKVFDAIVNVIKAEFGNDEPFSGGFRRLPDSRLEITAGGCRTSPGLIPRRTFTTALSTLRWTRTRPTSVAGNPGREWRRRSGRLLPTGGLSGQHADLAAGPQVGRREKADRDGQGNR